MTRRTAFRVLAPLLVVTLVAGLITLHWLPKVARTHVVAYFDNSNGISVGDDVVILGVKVGQVDAIEPQPQRAKISFWLERRYEVPAEADAVILVMRMGVTTRDSARRILRELKRIPGVNVAGVVINGIPTRVYRARSYGYYYG